MKKFLSILTVVAILFASGCAEEYDDTALSGRVDDLEERVTELEALCREMNSNISALQTLVNALQHNDYVTNVAPVMKNGVEIGYTISFSKGETITIYHGEDGAAGKDGYTPIISVELSSDGNYYWTLDGELLLDKEGNKIKAQGTDGKDGQDGEDGKDGQEGAPGKDGEDGKDGQDGAPGKDGVDGKDGITPQLKIEEGIWYISYDNGESWDALGKATGEDGKEGAPGKDGQDGDSFFQSVDTTTSDQYVYFTLTNGTVIQLPTWKAFEQLQRQCNEMNTNLEALQTIVEALQKKDYVQRVTPLMEEGKEVGYTITFTQSGDVTIYHGKDGQDGEKGENGQNGQDGYTPIISVELSSDGNYYWTLDGELLLDKEGNKIKAQGTDGKDGQDGEDGKDGQEGVPGENGITPQLKIEEGYWHISYNNGESWEQLGKATGDKGQDGDSFFQSVDTTTSDQYVYFTLANGTVIQLPTWKAFEALQLQCNELNTNLQALQVIVSALEQRDYIKSVTSLMEEGKEVGYTITFAKNGTITIYHGKDGQDGYTPEIGVKQDSDNIYYWTVDGEWLTDELGNKIQAEGVNGQDGATGATGENGITPQLKIEEGYWYISYNNGESWEQLGKATGDKGDKGDKGDTGLVGDSMFSDIDDSDELFVVFTLSNGTELKIPSWTAFEQLQRQCNEMNTNLEALQTIVEALQKKDYVQRVTPLMEEGKEVGYTITFTQSGDVTIYHGKDGQNGANGQDGQDGYTPEIGVKQDTDGIYYWTLDGEWLTDAQGTKVQAQGTNGQDGAPGENGATGEQGVPGQDGKEGITPQLKIEEGYWHISYNNGESWEQLGKATGEDGKDGQDGAPGKDGEDGSDIFSKVEYDEDFLNLTLADGTTLALPLQTSYLFNKIQSICFMPTYVDGMATMKRVLGEDDGLAELHFIVSPKNTIEEIVNYWNLSPQDMVVKALYAETRALDFISLPVVKCEGDKSNGVLSLTVSGENLSEEFFAGTKTLNAMLFFSDGNNNIVSNYFQMVGTSTNAPKKEGTINLSDFALDWEYATDAATDAAAASKRNYTRTLDIDLTTATINLPEEVSMSAAEIMNTTPAQITVNGLVDDKLVTFNSKSLTLNNFEWDKTYNIVAIYNLEKANITLSTKVTTTDRNRNTITITLDSSKVPYKSNLTLNEGDIFNALNVVYNEVKKTTQMGGITENQWLKENFSTNPLSSETNQIIYINNANKQNTTSTNPAWNLHLQIADDGLSVSTLYSSAYISNVTNSEIPKSLTYRKTFTTWYGQTIILEKLLNFSFEKFDFKHNTQYVTEFSDGSYKSTIKPNYSPSVASTALASYSPKDLDLTQAFHVIDSDGKVLTAEEIAGKQLKIVFSVEDSVSGVTITDNVLKYNSPVPSVNVIGKIYLINEDGSQIDLDTRFSNGGIYADYEVQSCDPIGPSSSVKSTTSVGAKESTEVNILNLISLKDDREGKTRYPLIDNENNCWVTGTGKNGFAEGKSVLDIYKITPKWKLSCNKTQYTEYIKFDADRGVLIFDNSKKPFETINFPTSKYMEAYVTLTVSTPWSSHDIKVTHIFQP